MQSLFLSSVGLVVTGEGIAFLGFMERHPSILAKMVTFGLASAAGQVGETINSFLQELLIFVPQIHATCNKILHRIKKISL